MFFNTVDVHIRKTIQNMCRSCIKLEIVDTFAIFGQLGALLNYASFKKFNFLHKYIGNEPNGYSVFDFCREAPSF